VTDGCLAEHGDSLKFGTNSYMFICEVRDSFLSVEVHSYLFIHSWSS